MNYVYCWNAVSQSKSSFWWLWNILNRTAAIFASWKKKKCCSHLHNSVCKRILMLYHYMSKSTLTSVTLIEKIQKNEFSRLIGALLKYYSELISLVWVHLHVLYCIRHRETQPIPWLVLAYYVHWRSILLFVVNAQIAVGAVVTLIHV